MTARGSGDRCIKKSNCFFFTWAAERQYGDKTWITVREHDVNLALNTSLENHRCGTWIPRQPLCCLHASESGHASSSFAKLYHVTHLQFGDAGQRVPAHLEKILKATLRIWVQSFETQLVSGTLLGEWEYLVCYKSESCGNGRPVDLT